MNYVKSLIRLAASVTVFASASCERVNAGSDWVDISAEIKKTLGGEAILPSELYLKKGFPVNIKSANLKGTIYKRVVLSWPTGSSTVKRDLLFDCSIYGYKVNDGTPGYWYALEWVLPDKKNKNVDAMAFRYFCAASKNPWQLLTANLDDEEYFINNSAAYQLVSKKYGKMYTWVVVKIGQFGMTEALRLYLSCGAKKVGFYSLLDAAGDQDIELGEANPGSIGAGIISDICKG